MQHARPNKPSAAQRFNAGVHATPLVQDFFLFAKLIVAAVMLVSLWFAWQIRSYEQEKIQSRLTGYAGRVDRELSDMFDYTTYLGEYLARQLSETDTANLEKVESLLINFGQNVTSQRVLTFSLFAWAGPDHRVVVDSLQGKLSRSIDISSRSYVEQGTMEPGKIHFSAPDVGNVSGITVIPAGIGVVSPDGRFLGTVALGIDLGNLVRNMQHVMDAENMRFAIFNDNFREIAKTPGASFEQTNADSVERLKQLSERKIKSGLLATPSMFGRGDAYVYFQRSEKYPYTIAVSFVKPLRFVEWAETYLPQLVEFVLMGCAVLVLLYFFRKRVVDPVVELSLAADKLSRGETGVAIPASGIHEIIVLSRYLARVHEYIAEHKRVERELRHKTNALREKSDALMQAKEEAERAHQTLSGYLSYVAKSLEPLAADIASECEQMLSSGIAGDQAESFRRMHESARFIMEIAKDNIDLLKAENGTLRLKKKALDPALVIAEAVKRLEGEMLRASSVRLELQVQRDLPALYADPARLEQILLNLLENAVQVTPEGRSVLLSAKAAEDGGVVIAVRDQGTGVPPQAIPMVLSKFGQMGVPADAKHTPFFMPLTKMLIALHGATLSMESEVGRGSVMLVHFPPLREYAEDEGDTPLFVL